MKKFIVQTLRGQTSIYECEVSEASDQPRNLKSGERLFLVESPAQFKGELWYSMFFRETPEECMALVEDGIRIEFARLSKKCCGNVEDECVSYTEEDIQSKLSEVKIVKA